MLKDLTVVIVNWNTGALVEKQVAVLSRFISHIVIIDNNSDKAIPKSIINLNAVTVIQNRINRGYAAACNQGLALVNTKWVLFLNPDVFFSEVSLSKFIQSAANHNYDAASVLSKSNDYTKPVPSLFSLLSEFTFLNRFIPQDLFTQRTLIGGILLIKTQIIKKIGGWDERFFLWFEDSDITKRLIEQKYSIGFLESAVEHSGAQSFKSIDQSVQKDIFFNSMEIYSDKHFNSLGLLCIRLLKRKYTKKKIAPSMNAEKTSIVIPNLRQELLDDFLRKNITPTSQENEFIIVSSAIGSDTIWSYRKKYPYVRFISIANNKGFAHTVNIGIRASSTDFVGTCNDDTLLQKNWTRNLLANTPKNFGSINPIILNQTKEIESAGIQVYLNGKAEPQKTIPKEDTSQVDATNAACVIYRRKSLEVVGIFDELFGSYLEDIDLSLRLSKKSFKNYVTKSTYIVHLKHQTTKAISFNKSFHDFKNWILVILKNWSISQIIINFPGIIIERLRNISGIFKSNF